MKWSVKYRNRRRIERAARDMPDATRRKLWAAIEDLEEQGPQPEGWTAGPLKNDPQDRWRLKLGRSYRIIYHVFRQILVIEIVKAGPREGIY